MRGEPSEPRACLDELLVQRAPRLRGRAGRLRPRTQAAQLAAQERASPRSRPRTCGRSTSGMSGSSGSVPSSSTGASTSSSSVAAAAATARSSTRSRARVRPESSTAADPDTRPWITGRRRWGTTRRCRVRRRARRPSLPPCRRCAGKELERGVTLVGRTATTCCSGWAPRRGIREPRRVLVLALALRLASAELLRGDSTSGDPVLVLDDVFAELDSCDASGSRAVDPATSRCSSRRRCSRMSPSRSRARVTRRRGPRRRPGGRAATGPTREPASAPEPQPEASACLRPRAAALRTAQRQA